MKKLSFFIVLLVMNSSLLFSQVSVNNDGSAADSSAMLDVKSTTRGILIPRITATERNAISNPATGLLIFCTDDNHFYSNHGTPSSPAWTMVSSHWNTDGTKNILNGGNVGIGTTNPTARLHIVGGDVKIGEVAGDAQKLYFGDGASTYIGEEAADNRLGLSGNTLTLSIGGSKGTNGQVLTSDGTTCSWVNPSMSGSGSSNYVARWTSSNSLGTGVIRDNNSTVGINTAPDANYRLRIDGDGINAIYGRFDDDHYGYLGKEYYGVQGLNGGTYGAGVYGDSYAESTGSPGVIGSNDAATNGTSYTQDNSVNGIVGFAVWGSPYHFGVFGTRIDHNYGPSGGVIGTVSNFETDKPWGALGFQDASLNEYAGYFNGNINLTAGLKDGSGYGVPGSVLTSNGSSDVYWSANPGALGSGTTGYIPKWSNSTTLTNSLLYDDGTKIGIGTISPAAKLTVNSNSTSTSVYGQYSNNILGYLGSTNYGTYGQYNANILGYLGGINYGAYGQNSSSQYGYLGSASYGAFGQYNSNIQGYLGSVNYGAYGQNSNTLFGYLGGSGYGVFGQNGSSIIGYLAGSSNGAYGQYNDNIKGYFGSANYGAYGQKSTTIYGYLGGMYGAYGQGSSTVYGYLGGGVSGAYGQYNTNILGYLGNTNYGAYGQHDSNIKGYFGSADYGAYGQHDSNIKGYLGGEYNGAYGQYSSDVYGCLGKEYQGVYGQYTDVIFGLLGTSYCGVWGYHGTPGDCAGYFHQNSSPTSFTKQWAVIGNMLNGLDNDGSSYSFDVGNSGSIEGINRHGAQYTFGVAGYNNNEDNRCSGVFGANQSASYWGALGYRSSANTNYGGYFTSTGSGGGKSAGSGSAGGIGIGAWGDLIGADIHGGVYGIYVEGNNFGIYSKGPVFSDQPAVQLQDVGRAERAVTYSSSSTDVTIMTTGQGRLVNGQSSVIFDENFREVISDQVPVNVTVTPLGPSHGVYISSVNANGFSIIENEDGRSNVEFSYIAVGRRAGYENPQLPAEIIASDFESNMKEGLHNDADRATDGKGLHYQDSALRLGHNP